MIKALRGVVRLLSPARDKLRELKAVIAWATTGKPAPPPHHIKRRAVRSYARNFSLPILVETGTYVGQMVKAMERHFEQFYSIELDKDLYERASQQFARNPNVSINHGDSTTALPQILKTLSKPALFWLDAHA